MDTNKIAIPISIVLAGLIIGVAVYLSNNKKPTLAEQKIETTTNEMRPVSNEDHILGSPDADLILVEYSDTECPYCKMFHETMHQIMDEYGQKGKVAWVYRHFPIDQLHPKARKEAEATECANELGGVNAFWKYTDTLYEKTPSNNGLDPKELPKIAKDIGLDEKAFNACLNSGKYASKVQADYDDAIKSGGRGTPHSIIILKDGSKVPVSGAQPYQSLKETIDILLN